MLGKVQKQDFANNQELTKRILIFAPLPGNFKKFKKRIVQRRTTFLNSPRKKNAEKIHLYWLWRRRATLFLLSDLPHLFRCLYKPGLNKRRCIYSRMDNIFLRKLIFPLLDFFCLMVYFSNDNVVTQWRFL